MASDLCSLGLSADFITYTCSVTYNGSLAPALEWTQRGSDGKIILRNVTKVSPATVSAHVLLIFGSVDSVSGLDSGQTLTLVNPSPLSSQPIESTDLVH